MLLQKLKQIGSIGSRNNFLLKNAFSVNEFRLNVFEYIHEPSGAVHLHFDRDDKNKAFCVMFRTSPPDDSGIAHILEHNVLCGSEKFPVRDPFFKMLRRSQASFMNACTGVDLTFYPFCTANDKDYMNLMSVYLDAVFKPNLSKYDFLQESWRLEPENLQDSNSPFEFKGIVFNEMKGVYSDSHNSFARDIQRKLLPVTYKNDSGGIPLDIPSLTLKKLRDYHKKLYHPSNATFLTYGGNMDLESILDFISNNYLNTITKQPTIPYIDLEPTWNSPRSIDLKCQTDSMNAYPDRPCLVSLSYKIGDSQNVYENFVFNILSNLLVSGENAPLYKSLITETQLGLDWASSGVGFDDSTRSTSFHISLQNVKESDVSRIESKIVETLEEVKKNGFPQARLEAILHQYEIGIRHETSLFGLKLLRKLMSPLSHGASGENLQKLLHIQALIDYFKVEYEKKNPKEFFSDIIDKHLLKNPHKLFSVMREDNNHNSELALKEKHLLQSLVSNLSGSEKNKYIENCKKLHELQAKPQDISVLPCLKIEDIPKTIVPETFTTTTIGENVTVHLNEASTNELLYVNLLVSLNGLDSDLLNYVPLFCQLFTRIGAENMNFLEFAQAEELVCTGFNISPCLTPTILPEKNFEDLDKPIISLHLSTSSLKRNIEKTFDLLSRLFMAPDWNDVKRIEQLIQMSTASDWSANALAHSAHQYALKEAASSLNATSYQSNLWNGLKQAKFVLQDLAKRINTNDKELIFQNLRSIWLFVKNNRNSRIKASLHGSSQELQEALPHLEKFIKKLDTSLITPNPSNLSISTNQYSQSRYFSMPYTVHYNATSVRAPHWLHPDFANYNLLGTILTSKYIHREIREKGGAYGANCHASSGRFSFYTYRDPSAVKSIEAFDSALDWVTSNQRFNEQDLLEAKLSIFQAMDTPVSAGSKGQRVFLTNRTDELMQLYRERLLSVNLEGIQTAAEDICKKSKSSSDRFNCILGPESTAINEKLISKGWKIETLY